jgi:uncharacterized SAM-binding protein YcdF (DUF218 family)
MALRGMLTRRERWGLSWRGWVAVILFCFAFAALAIFRVFPFLAVSDRQPTDILVSEGWLPDYAVQRVAAEFRTGGYARVFATGGPISGMGGYTNDYNTAASVGAGRLRAAGVPSEVVQMVPSRVLRRDRTYSSALALRSWFRANNVRAERINVATEAPHARRTQLLFQLAFGKDTRVGVIPIQNPDYDPKRWWRYSEGVRDVIGEALALIYAEFLFVPEADEGQAQT